MTMDIVDLLRDEAARDDHRGAGFVLRQAADEIVRLRVALSPFAGDKLPSPRRTEIAYNRHGLRCAMSPMEIARTAACATLSPAHSGPAEPIENKGPSQS